MKPFQKIFIIGFMGSGKSTVGKKLARFLNFRFIDLDREIELEAGCSIPKIFGESGEEYFRKMEQETLCKVISLQENIVVSTGGGTPCYFDNIKLINNSGISIYLKMEVSALCHRVQNSTVNRPLLKDLDEEAQKTKVEELLTERSVFYEQAGIMVNGLDIKIIELRNKIYGLRRDENNE